MAPQGGRHNRQICRRDQRHEPMTTSPQPTDLIRQHRDAAERRKHLVGKASAGEARLNHQHTVHQSRVSNGYGTRKRCPHCRHLRSSALPDHHEISTVSVLLHRAQIQENATNIANNCGFWGSRSIMPISRLAPRRSAAGDALDTPASAHHKMVQVFCMAGEYCRDVLGSSRQSQTSSSISPNSEPLLDPFSSS